MTKLTVQLSRPFYFPGEMVEGQALLSAPKPVELRGISLQAEGCEHTSITVHHGKHSTTYVSRHDILQYSQALSGPCQLPSGDYSYPFRFQLPPDALPTYKGYHANVRYNVMANADIPMWFDAKQTVEVPVVLPRRGIRPPQNLQGGLFRSETADRPGRPAFQAKLSRLFFLAGETIEGTISILSTGSKRLRKADVSLIAVECAEAQGREAENETPVAKCQLPGEQLTDGVSSPFSLQIPPQVYSTYSGLHSSLAWVVRINLDLAMAFDVSADQQVAVVNAV